MRFQGIPQEDPEQGGEESRERFLAIIVQANHVSIQTKIRLIAELEESSINQNTPFSDQSEDMIHSSRNVEGFELCQLFDRLQFTQ